PHVRASWLGSVPSRPALDLQAGLVRALRGAGGADALLVLEQPPVFAVGTAAAPGHALWHDADRRRRPVRGVRPAPGAGATSRAAMPSAGRPRWRPPAGSGSTLERRLRLTPATLRRHLGSGWSGRRRSRERPYAASGIRCVTKSVFIA